MDESAVNFQPLRNPESRYFATRRAFLRPLTLWSLALNESNFLEIRTFDLYMRALRSILSLAFAFLVLFSSTSFIVGIHRCGGELKNLAIFDKAESCEKEQQLPPCHRKESPPCCQDVTVVHENEDFKTDVSQNQFSAPLLQAAVLPVVVLTEVVPAHVIQKPFSSFDPPLRSQDLTIALRVFLI